jgi:hypothetical protein
MLDAPERQRLQSVEGTTHPGVSKGYLAFQPVTQANLKGAGDALVGRQDCLRGICIAAEVQDG